MLEVTTNSIRGLQCIEYLQTVVPYTLSRLYTEHILPSGTKEQIEIMASEIKTAFIQRLQNNNWIDQPTRQASINKVNHIVGSIPSWGSFVWFKMLLSTDVVYLVISRKYM